MLVEGVNRIKKHTRYQPDPARCAVRRHRDPGSSIHVSNVMVVDSDGKPTRVGYRIGEDGKKVRVSRKNGKDI